MNDNLNNVQAIINAPPSKQEDNGRSDSTVPNSRDMMIGGTTVRLSFSDSGDLNTRLANAFNSMLQ